MSNETNNIDELFRGKLRDFSVETPEHVWKGIEASRTPLHRAINYFKSKKGAALSSVILLTVAGSIAYFMGANTTQLSQNNTTAYSIQRYNNSASIQAANYNDANAIQPKGDYSSQSSSTNNSTSKKSQKNYLAVNSEEFENTIVKNNSTNKGNSTPNASNGITTDNSEGKKPLNTQTTLPKKDKPVTIPSKNKDEDNTPVITQGTENTTSKKDKTKAQKTDDVLTADVTPTTKGDGVDKADKSKGQKKSNIVPDKQYSKYTLDVYAGGNYTMRSLTNNGIDNNYFAAKRDAESYRPGFVLGARVNYDIKDVLRLRVGAQYTRFSQHLNLEREYKYNTIKTTTGVILDPVTQQPIGTTTRTDTIENTETVNANTTNTISFIDIPVQFEVDVYKKGKLSVFASAGAVMNLRFTQTGHQLNQRLTGLDEISSTNNPFKTTTGVSLIAGAGINYELNKRYSLLFETNYQHGINNVMKSNAGMSQSFRMFTGSIGLRYRF